MDFITFELIGKVTTGIIFLMIIFFILYWCVDVLPMKIINTFKGNRSVVEYMMYRKKFKQYLRKSENEK